MDLERIKERLVKMKAMAERGVGGERDAADRLLREIAENGRLGRGVDGADSRAQGRGGGVMWCSNCPNFDTCEDPAKLGGGCDIDGADDFGVDPVEDMEVE